MATPVSVVIISFNAAATIQRTLRSAAALSKDVIVVDSGSTDATPAMVIEEGATLIKTNWKGYGANKNQGNAAARNNWILSLDADEELSPELIRSIREKLNPASEDTVYRLNRLNYLDNQPVFHGEWGKDHSIRLFNRQVVHWDESPVHENLVLPAGVKIVNLDGWLHHYTATDIDTYRIKLDKYATLMAEKYFARGKKASALKLYLAPTFNFVKQYLLRGGWKDRKVGWQIAMAHAHYTFLKYKKLRDKVRNHTGPDGSAEVK